MKKSSWCIFNGCFICFSHVLTTWITPFSSSALWQLALLTIPSIYSLKHNHYPTIRIFLTPRKNLSASMAFGCGKKPAQPVEAYMLTRKSPHRQHLGSKATLGIMRQQCDTTVPSLISLVLLLICHFRCFISVPSYFWLLNKVQTHPQDLSARKFLGSTFFSPLLFMLELWQEAH